MARIERRNYMQNTNETQPRQTGNIVHIIIAITAIFLFMGAILGITIVHESNKISRQYQAVQAQYGQVETVIQRRSDLIPNVTATVRGEMHNEQKIFGEIAQARSALRNASTSQAKFKANNELDKSINVLVNSIQERYPELASDKRVQSLIVELEGSENRISVERHRYNQIVEEYNTTLTTFPSSMFKGAHHKISYFKADASAHKAPKVDLD